MARYKFFSMKKHELVVDRYKEKLKNLKGEMRKNRGDVSSCFDLSQALSKLPRRAHKERLRNICPISGRARGYYRFFGLARHTILDLAKKQLLDGVTQDTY